MTAKQPATDRKKQILDEAVKQAQAGDYRHIRREAIASALGVSTGLISLHFGTMQQLVRAVMGAAIARGIPEIIAQGLAAKDPRAMNAPESLKQLAIASLTN